MGNICISEPVRVIGLCSPAMVEPQWAVNGSSHGRNRHTRLDEAAPEVRVYLVTRKYAKVESYTARGRKNWRLSTQGANEEIEKIMYDGWSIVSDSDLARVRKMKHT